MKSWLAVVAAMLLSACAVTDRFTGANVEKQLRSTGVHADARVLQIWDTGVTVNHDPVVGFLLEVQMEGRAPYQARTKGRVSRLEVPRVQPGATLAVLVDPHDPTRVALERSRR